jgi:hypothetical protein
VEPFSFTHLEHIMDSPQATFSNQAGLLRVIILLIAINQTQLQWLEVSFYGCTGLHLTEH